MFYNRGMTTQLDKPLFLLDEHGEKSAVLLPIAQYEQMLEALDCLTPLVDEPEVEKFLPHVGDDPRSHPLSHLLSSTDSRHH